MQPEAKESATVLENCVGTVVARKGALAKFGLVRPSGQHRPNTTAMTIVLRCFRVERRNKPRLLEEEGAVLQRAVDLPRQW
jgi:hypothetical protein